MKAAGFRKIALSLTGAIEAAHMGHPDFRVGDRVFASLRGDLLWGMVALTPDQQREFVQEYGETFVPETGAWGRTGYTKVNLALADEDTLGRALTLARQNAIDKNTAKRSRTIRRARKSSAP